MMKGIFFGKETDNKFTWGDSARVKNTAPLYFHPGEIVSIWGMTKIESEKLANKYKTNLGEWLYTIEYIGGADTEIPEKFLEKYESSK